MMVHPVIGIVSIQHSSIHEDQQGRQQHPTSEDGPVQHLRQQIVPVTHDEPVREASHHKHIRRDRDDRQIQQDVQMLHVGDLDSGNLVSQCRVDDGDDEE